MLRVADFLEETMIAVIWFASSKSSSTRLAEIRAPSIINSSQ